ncbi:UNVERIFIED_CONTAM: hypothetical protein Slati_2355400 [Sesamum latifolium]|uniref:Uncharacterized protein n=1 Tax=Sesamum latifolium TaxID=2727402 RepID=A0AAW2WAI2_9LAMI
MAFAGYHHQLNHHISHTAHSSSAPAVAAPGPEQTEGEEGTREGGVALADEKKEGRREDEEAAEAEAARRWGGGVEHAEEEEDRGGAQRRRRCGGGRGEEVLVLCGWVGWG